MSHANGLRRLDLTGIYGKYAAANGFRHVCAGVYGNNEKSGEQGVHMYVEQHTRSVIDENGLNNHRRSAENFDINFQNCVHDPEQNPLPERVFFACGNCLNCAYQKADNAANKRAHKRD